MRKGQIRAGIINGLFFCFLPQSLGRVELRCAAVGIAYRRDAIQGIWLTVGRVRRGRQHSSPANTQDLSRGVGKADEVWVATPCLFAARPIHVANVYSLRKWNYFPRQ